MKTSDALLTAVDVLYERGHTKRELENERGEVCALGAVKVVLYGNAFATATEEIFPVMDYVALAIGPDARFSRRDKWGGTSQVVEWNNMLKRTFGEVVDAFERAAKLAEADE